MRYFSLFLLLLPLTMWAQEKHDNEPKEIISFFPEKNRSLDNISHIDYAIVDDFNINNNWKVGEQWVFTQSGESEAVIGQNEGYYPNIDSRLVSPVIKLPEISYNKNEKIRLSFDEVFSMEDSYDKGYVEVSIDDGRNWEIVDSRTGSSDNEWRNTSVYLDNYSGQQIRVAFRFKSDESFSGEGWKVKNISIDKSKYASESDELRQVDSRGLKSANAGITGTMNNLSSQNFPYIYMNILLSEDGMGVSNLLKSNFTIYENNTLISNYNVVAPNSSSGSKLVDIVFLVDNSGSFDDEQNAVRNNMEKFVNQLAVSGNDFALGLCRFGQSSISGYPILEDNGQLTSNVDYFKNDVWLRNVTSGSVEVGYHAIVQSAQGFSFRPGSQKIFIILTDESPDQGGSTKEQATMACVNNYVTLFAMTNGESAALNDISAATNGRSYDITDPFTDILNDISASVNNNYLLSYSSPNPTFDGVERDVEVDISSTGGSETTVSGSYIPGAAPQITRSQSTIDYEAQGWPENTAFNISVIVTDEQEPYASEVILYYKHTDATQFSSVQMSNTSGNNWSASIPSSVSLRPGVDYYITASDGSVTSSLPKVNPNSNPFQIGILPNEKPVIVHTPPAESYNPGQTLTFDAAITDNTNKVAWAKLYYRTPGELVYKVIDMQNTSGDIYSVQVATSISANGVEYYIVAADDFDMKSSWASADEPYSIGSGQQLANLTPHAISEQNWTSPLLISTIEEAWDDTPVITDEEEIFVSFAYINNGNADAGEHEIQLLIDGALFKFWAITFDTPYDVYNYLFDFSIGTLDAGEHTMTLIVDSENDISESDESDNEFTKTFEILTSNTALADLQPYAPEGWEAPVVPSSTEGSFTKSEVFYDDEDIYASFAYANYGEGDAGIHYNYFIIDETDTIDWDEEVGLESNFYNSVDSHNMGQFDPGEHIIRFEIDAWEEVYETDENNNVYIDTFEVIARYMPNLAPYQPSGWDAALVVSTMAGTTTNANKITTNDFVYIDGAFDNTGEIESGSYSVRIYVDSVLTTFEDDEGIDLTTYKYIDDFEAGYLSEGEHEITMIVDCFNDVAESDETDNTLTVTINVERPTGSNKLSEQTFNVWPVPANNHLNVASNDQAIGKLQMFDMTGRLIHQLKLNNQKDVTININQVPDGVYFLHIENDQGRYYKKVVVQRE
ncbi:MAG: VWA domain-containing protein [Prolixibacteraceae bacterium]|jgi:hypothetical protein|nr:VWA domain-containing protein [Prolixibacteraceae bacterium]